MKAVLDLPEAHTRALKVVLERVPPEEVRWALTGSAALRLQGLDLAVHDLDLQSEGEAVYLIERRLAEFIKTPLHLWETAQMRSLDGKAEIEGIQVELLANIAHLLPDGNWSGFTDFSRLVWLDWSGGHVPVFPLADEAEAYASMGRLEKAARIRTFLAGLPPS
jgi:hypothetical protein